MDERMTLTCWKPRCLAILLLLYVSPAGAADVWLSHMQELASGFQKLEQESAAGIMAGVVQQAERINRQAQAIAGESPDVAVNEQTVITGHLQSLMSLSVQLSASANSGDRRHVAWYVEQMRNTCVSCHAATRDLDNLAGFYPARGNTVIADVSVLSADGQLYQDRSESVVFVDGLVQPVTGTDDPRPVISQRERQFSPRLLPIVRGTTVDFPNDDSILHNVFSLSKTRKFDLDVYQPGKSKSVNFSEPGLVRIYCNIHPEMTCSVLVLNNPYFATTDASGRCVISGVPDGELSVRTWRELGGEARRSVSLNGASVVRVSLDVREVRRSLAHRNKFGQEYSKRSKYK